MKNIHILSTDKPSRLYFDVVRKELLLQKKLSIGSTSFPIEKKNIYITSDEEIKRNDYWINVDNNTISNGEMFELANDAPSCKKIILTTDQDLIDVQAIDDEFLEWFVNNPSCEEVETKLVEQRSHLTLNDWVDEDENGKFPISIAGAFCYRKIYKIIIPKEGPITYEDFIKNASKELLDKFDTDCLKYSEDGNSDNYFYANCKFWENKLKEEPKQETLEEAAERLFPDSNIQKRIFIKGAKWQQKTSYSEEEVINLLQDFANEDFANVIDIKEWFDLKRDA